MLIHQNEIIKAVVIHQIEIIEPMYLHQIEIFETGLCSGNLKVDKSNRAGAQRRGDDMTEPAA